MKQMIPKSLYATVVLAGLLAGLQSCDKEETTLTAKEKQLTAREWKITDITRKKTTDPTQDSSIHKACTTDDRLVFSMNGNNRSFQLKDNTAKCDSAIFFYDNGNWAFNNLQDQIQLTGAKRTQQWKILLLNDSILRVQWRDSLSTTNNVLKIISLKNK